LSGHKSITGGGAGRHREHSGRDAGRAVPGPLRVRGPDPRARWARDRGSVSIERRHRLHHAGHGADLPPLRDPGGAAGRKESVGALMEPAAKTARGFWRSVVQTGALWGAGATFLALVGSVEAVSRRPLVPRLLSLTAASLLLAG